MSHKLLDPLRGYVLGKPFPMAECPRCECGSFARYVVGAERRPLCPDGLDVWRDQLRGKVLRRVVKA